MMANRDRAVRRVMAALRQIEDEYERDEAVAALLEVRDTPPELMGGAEAAAALGVQRTNLHKHRVKDMPQPVQRISGGHVPVYVAEQIRAYADTKRGG